MTHTPGPWKTDGVRVGASADKFVARVLADAVDQRQSNFNAHLISAAPEMLDICEKVLAEVESLDPALRRLLNNVITKARGRSYACN